MRLFRRERLDVARGTAMSAGGSNYALYPHMNVLKNVSSAPQPEVPKPRSAARRGVLDMSALRAEERLPRAHGASSSGGVARMS